VTDKVSLRRFPCQV